MNFYIVYNFKKPRCFDPVGSSSVGQSSTDEDPTKLKCLGFEIIYYVKVHV